MIYKRYTIEKKIKYPVLYKCESCGKYSLIMHPFSSTTSYTNRGTWTEKGVEKRESAALRQLDKQMSHLFRNVEQATKN